MIIEPLLPVAGALRGPLLAELTALYASNLTFQQLSGDFPDPDDIRPEQVAASLAEELANPDTEVLLARSQGRLAGVAITLAHHPDPADPDPWIGLLMVDARQHRSGYGRRLAGLVEERFRQPGGTASGWPSWRTTPRRSPSGPRSATTSSTTAATTHWVAPARCCARR